MDPILTSILDNDTYKFTMQQAVLELHPTASVSYRFKNRGKQRFSVEFLRLLKEQINYMRYLALSHNEYSYIRDEIPFLKPLYAEYLKNYRYNPDEVECYLEGDDLVIHIRGNWGRTMLWEVPLMATISELYFKVEETDWAGNIEVVMREQTILAQLKHDRLVAVYCYYVDFGTRRRRSYAIQENFIKTQLLYKDSYFVGTSNVHFAMKFGIKPIGTYAHEWVMGNSVLEGLRNSNYYAMQNWKRVYCANLGIALTDTYGTDSFLRNFTLELAKVYDGVRHDSGCPLKFADKIIAHYMKLSINPTSKTIVFSDGLNVDKVIEIANYCNGRIRFSFGIGTHFTNDGFRNSPALNMVIKLWSVNGVPVVKLSDTPGKIMGDPEAVRVAQWTFNNKSLD